MESKISIETNDNFQNFLLLALSEFESKKIQEDLDKVKKIDENHYSKKLEIESLRKIVRDYHKDSREKDNNVEKLLVLTTGNPDVVFSLCIESYRLDLDMEIVIEDFCLAQNMLIVEVFNNIFENMKFKRRINILNNMPDKDIIHESIKFDKTIVVGSHGTALSTIINYYDETFGYSDFDKIRYLMPWIVEFTFEDKECINIRKYNLFEC